MSTILKACVECNVEFKCSLREHNRGNGKFCSLSCAAKCRNKNIPILTKLCGHCGKSYETTSKYSKVCSFLCKQKNYRSKRNNQSKNERELLESLRELPCTICGWNETIRDVHHIIPVSKGGKNELSNLITLCPNHHRMADKNLISEDSLRQAIESRTISSPS